MNRPKHQLQTPISDSDETEELNKLAALALHQHGFDWSDEHVVRHEIHDRTISLAHEVAKELMQPGPAPFSLQSGLGGRATICSTPLGERLRKVFSADFDAIRAEYPLHQFSPVFEVFSKLRRLLPFHASSYLSPQSPGSKEQIWFIVLRMVALLRQMLGRAATKAAHENFRRGAIDNFNGLCDGVDYLSQRHKEVSVLRFDLTRRPAGSEPARFGDTPNLDGLDELMDCRERFHRALDRRFGDKLWGYAWVLEYGRESRFHIHYLVLLDPQGTEDDCGLVELLRKKWVALTTERGDLYNCNAHRGRYKYPVLGRVRLDNPDTVTGLRFLISYMTLAPLFVKLDVQKKYRKFAKGCFPATALPKVGHPTHQAPGSRIKISVAQARASYLNFM